MAPRAGRPIPHLVVPRVERHHRLIVELRHRAPRHVSGERLALDLGVSVRTIERDIEGLMKAGIPIDVRRGPGGGYSIDARSKLEPVVLTPGEAAAIIAALVTIGPYTSPTADSALKKLVRALTP
jgi:predicted DNA-binding transcriptional regulator YafY